MPLKREEQDAIEFIELLALLGLLGLLGLLEFIELLGFIGFVGLVIFHNLHFSFCTLHFAILFQYSIIPILQLRPRSSPFLKRKQ